MGSGLIYGQRAPADVAKTTAAEHYLNTGIALDPVLLQFVRLRASQSNNCMLGIHLHTHSGHNTARPAHEVKA